MVLGKKAVCARGTKAFCGIYEVSASRKMEEVLKLLDGEIGTYMEAVSDLITPFMPEVFPEWEAFMNDSLSPLLKVPRRKIAYSVSSNPTNVLTWMAQIDDKKLEKDFHYIWNIVYFFFWLHAGPCEPCLAYLQETLDIYLVPSSLLLRAFNGLAKLGFDSRAISLFKRIASGSTLGQESVDLHYTVAVILAEHFSQHESALVYFKSCLSLIDAGKQAHTSLFLIHWNKGRTLAHLNRHDDATASFLCAKKFGNPPPELMSDLLKAYVKVEQYEDLLEECEFAKDTYEPTWDKVFNTFHITAIAKLNIPAPDQAISRVPISEDSNMKSIKVQLDKLLQEADCEESDSQEMETNKPEIENSVEKIFEDDSKQHASTNEKSSKEADSLRNEVAKIQKQLEQERRCLKLERAKVKKLEAQNQHLLKRVHCYIGHRQNMVSASEKREKELRVTLNECQEKHHDCLLELEELKKKMKSKADESNLSDNQMTKLQQQNNYLSKEVVKKSEQVEALRRGVQRYQIDIRTLQQSREDLKITANRWKEEFRKVKVNFANYCQSQTESLRKKVAESFEADAKKWKEEADRLRHESHAMRMELAVLRESIKKKVNGIPKQPSKQFSSRQNALAHGLHRNQIPREVDPTLKSLSFTFRMSKLMPSTNGIFPCGWNQPHQAWVQPQPI